MEDLGGALDGLATLEKHNGTRRMKSWNREDSPRERLLLKDQRLSVSELISIILSTGSRQANALELARLLLSRFEGLGGLLHAPPGDLACIHGVGIAKIARIKAVKALLLRWEEESLNRSDGRMPFDTSHVVRKYLTQQLAYRDREVFACLFLDTRNRFIEFFEAAQGTVNRAHVYPREILRAALRVNAVGVVLAHNHPSGVAEPSQADIAITRDLTSLLEKIDVCVLDHIVVAREGSVSLAERGLIA